MQKLNHKNFYAMGIFPQNIMVCKILHVMLCQMPKIGLVQVEGFRKASQGNAS